jgi:hypothetical protein
MNHRQLLASLFCGACAACAAADASTITPIDDQFNDATLSPTWAVSFENASGWTANETGGSLTVTDIAATVNNAGSGGAFVRAILSQSFTPLADFNASCVVAWDSENDVQAMQGVGIRLFDTTGTFIVGAEYVDGWVAYRGTRLWDFGGTRNHSGRGLLAFSGTAALGIARVGSDVDVTWDGAPLASGTSSSPIGRVDLMFWYYPFTGFEGVSFFGTESIDSVTVSGSPVAVVPEPSTMLLMAAGLACVVGARLRRRPTCSTVC